MTSARSAARCARSSSAVVSWFWKPIPGGFALDTLATDPGIAAVVSDFLMPELDGLDFYDALVARSPHLKNRVVFLTGAARDPTVYQPLEDRGVPLINKLEDLHIVLDAVRLVLLRSE